MDLTARNLFKPVEGGYVFRVPYQLGLREVRHYLVSESQKAALVAAIAGQRPARTRSYLALAGAVAIIAAALIVMALSPHSNPMASDTFAMIALATVLVLIGAAGWRCWKLRQLAPLLAQLQPTELTITRAEMRRAAIAGTATSHLRLNVILSAIVGGIYLATAAYAISGGQAASTSMIAGIIFIGIAVYNALLVAGRRGTQ
jgi:hypothetical protein